jgi:hypothetical protein
LILKFAIASPIMNLWIHLGLFILSFDWVLMLKPLLNYISRWSSLFTMYLRKMGLLEVRSNILLDPTTSHMQCSLFVLTTKSSCQVGMVETHNYNLLTRLWKQLPTFQNVVHQMLEYIKLTKVTIVQIVGLMEDEQCFNTLNFMKSTFQNRLRNSCWLSHLYDCSKVLHIGEFS